MKCIQENGDRHYLTEHGIYVIVNYEEYLHAGSGKTTHVWEIFAPKGLNFNSCHSYIEYSLKDAKHHVGSGDNVCDGSEGCGCVFDPFMKEVVK